MNDSILEALPQVFKDHLKKNNLRDWLCVVYLEIYLRFSLLPMNMVEHAFAQFAQSVVRQFAYNWYELANRNTICLQLEATLMAPSTYFFSRFFSTYVCQR